MKQPAIAPPARRRGEPALRILLSAFMLLPGVLHFTSPEPFVRIMPSWLPRAWDLPLVYFTGVCEVAAAIGLNVPRVRRATAYALIVFFVAVFPANVQAAVHPEQAHVTRTAALVRLPFQILLILWAYRYTRRERV